MFKVDLHTHSVVSPDGGITEKEYTEIIAKKVLDYIAITDHNKIDFAQMLHKKLGDAVIIGEEIMTTGGEVIGLFLSKKVTPHQSILSTLQAIHAQGGLVYMPHPFDIFRKGIGGKNLKRYVKEIDIVEGFNGRMVWRKNNREALEFAKKYTKTVGVGSDAHSSIGIGKTYAIIEKVTKESIKEQLGSAQFVMNYQPVFAYLSPTIHKMRKIFSR